MKKTILWGLCLLSLYPLQAIQTRSIVQSTFSDFMGGELSQLSLSQEGEMKLGAGLEVWAELEETIIFDAISDGKGNLYVATGNDGAIYRISSEGEVKLLFKPEEMLVRALTLDSQGNLYAGASPSGRIYRLKPEGNPEIFCVTDTEYVWDIAIDSEDTLFVATGSPAKVLRIPATYQLGDEFEEWYDAKEEHLTLLRWEKEDVLLAASSPQAFLYRIAGEGEGDPIFHTESNEITDLTVAQNGEIFLSTLAQGKPSNAYDSPLDLAAILERAQYAPQATLRRNEKGNGESKESSSSSNSGGQPSLIYRLKTNGYAEPIWSPGKGSIYAFAKQGDRWLVGNDRSGQLFEFDDLGQWQLLQQAEQGGEISMLLATDKVNYVMTSNPAVVYRMENEASEKGEFISSIIDAKQAAQWGMLRAQGALPGEQEGVTWFSQSGNTPKPDESWSDWKETEAGRIVSPLSRYLGLKAEFTDPTVGIQELRVFYVLNNAAPLVSRVNVLPVGIQILNIASPKKQNVNLSLLTGSQSLPKGGKGNEVSLRQQIRVTGEQGQMSVGWLALDPNDDELLYDLRVKAEGEENWVTLAEGLRESAFSFNARGLADGYYRVEVTADDRLSNVAGTERRSSKVSKPFLIDNTNPEVSLEEQVAGAEAGSYQLTFSAHDAHSILVDASYILDGEAPYYIHPEDMIYDSQNENLVLKLSSLDAGRHSVVLEVVDEAGNRGSRQAVFEIE